MNDNSCKILIGLDSILKHLQLSEPTFKKFITMGMPAVVISGRWYAHVDNLDDYFRRITKFRQDYIPGEAENINTKKNKGAEKL